MLRDDRVRPEAAARRDDGGELFPVVDETGRVVGRATRRVCHGGSMLLHPVVHLHLFNSRGELYLFLQPQRSQQTENEAAMSSQRRYRWSSFLL